MRTLRLVTCFVCFGCLNSHDHLHAQLDSLADMDPGRTWAIGLGGAAVIGGTFAVLDQAWYSQYERTAFHGFNDGDEWLQMDKCGHVYSSYWIARWAKGLTNWAGIDRKTGAWVGFITANVYLGGVEVLDGFSSGWGFSGWDMVANISGSSLFLVQELAWNQQRIKLRYTAWPSTLASERPELLGRNFGERILKDYNGQTVWATLAWGAVSNHKGLGSALGVAVGYGGGNMITASSHTVPIDVIPLEDPRYRRFLLSLDLDLERIPARSKALRTILFFLNAIKIPAPALEVRSTGRVLVHGLYF